MDSTAQWTQDFGVAKSMAEMSAAPINACTRSSPASTERKIRPQKDQAVNCPRCNSTNTKFCYYNNYSLTQPRYFCKTCRRYWTEGGTLRNVPVGGGSRKNKKSININSATSSSSSSLSSHKLPDLNPNSQFSSHDHHHQLHQNPKIHDQGHDLNLGFHGPPPEYGHGMIPQFLEFPKNESTANSTITKDHILNMSSTTSSSNPISALNFLRINGARGLNSFIPMAPNALENNSLFASSGINFPFQECKPSLGFSIDGASRFANPNGVTQDSSVNGSLMFTLGGAKRSDQDHDQNDQGSKGQENSNGFWNGMLGGGNW